MTCNSTPVPFGACDDHPIFPATSNMAARLLSTSASVVAQEETLMSTAGHAIPPNSLLHDRQLWRHISADQAAGLQACPGKPISPPTAPAPTWAETIPNGHGFQVICRDK